MEKPKTEKIGRFATRLTKFRKWGLKRSLKKLENTLNNLAERLAKKGEINQQFFNFIREYVEDNQQAAFWTTVLNREDLIPYDLYEISMIISDKALKAQAEKRLLKEAQVEELYEIFMVADKDLQKMIWQEIDERIKYKMIRKNQAWQHLSKIMENVPDYREEALVIFQYLDPPDSELKRLIDSPTKKDDIVMAKFKSKIEKFMRERKRKKDFNVALIANIRNTSDRIKQLKQGQ